MPLPVILREIGKSSSMSAIMAVPSASPMDTHFSKVPLSRFNWFSLTKTRDRTTSSTRSDEHSEFHFSNYNPLGQCAVCTLDTFKMSVDEIGQPWHGLLPTNRDYRINPSAIARATATGSVVRVERIGCTHLLRTHVFGSPTRVMFRSSILREAQRLLQRYVHWDTRIRLIRCPEFRFIVSS